MADEFKIGDVLAIVGQTTKWLVLDASATHVVISELGVPTMPYFLSREHCERDWFKIGTWDFEREMEVDDDGY